MGIELISCMFKWKWPGLKSKLKVHYIYQLDIILFVVSTEPVCPDLNVSSLQCGLLSPAHSSCMSGPKLFPLRSSSLRWAKSELRDEPIWLELLCVRPHQLSLTDGRTFQIKIQHTTCDIVMINAWSVHAEIKKNSLLDQFIFISYIYYTGKRNKL